MTSLNGNDSVERFLWYAIGLTDAMVESLVNPPSATPYLDQEKSHNTSEHREAPSHMLDQYSDRNDMLSIGQEGEQDNIDKVILCLCFLALKKCDTPSWLCLSSIANLGYGRGPRSIP